MSVGDIVYMYMNSKCVIGLYPVSAWMDGYICGCRFAGFVM